MSPNYCNRHPCNPHGSCHFDTASYSIADTAWENGQSPLNYVPALV